MTTERTKNIVISDTTMLGEQIFAVLERITGSQEGTNEADRRFVQGINELLDTRPEFSWIQSRWSKKIAERIATEGEDTSILAKMISQGLSRIELALNPDWPEYGIKRLWSELR